MESGRNWGRGTEWHAVRVLLASQVRTPMGRERAQAAAPLFSRSDVHAALTLTTEARLGMAAGGPPPLDGLVDVRPALAQAGTPGSVLEGVDLVRMLPFLDAGPRLVGWAGAIGGVAPTVAAIAEGLPRLSELRAALRRALDDDGTVSDRAGDRLARVRRELRDGRRRLVADLERLVTADSERVFADRFVTVRNGRYVVPLRAEARARLRGIVHDRSQSGSTLFVEPESVVEANNELVQLTRQEEQEVRRVLADLTEAVRTRIDDLERLVDGIGALDWIAARASLAERMQASAPSVEPDNPVSVRAARHPLLLAQTWEDPARSVVPIEIELSRERPLLLITGPNAGGKTIALKTVGLLALLAQTGCHVPAAEGARLPLFERFFAIVGDDQSVADNLSTFSAFIKQVRHVLDEANARSLVLLDELGAGTDPEEGAALAQAILEALEARGALVVATTHLEPLRTFASTHAGARNASVTFDAVTLTPTFRLVYDRPGPSYALAIAARLGLGRELIERAQAHRSEQAVRVAALLSELDARSRAEAEKTRELERREAETAARLAAAQEIEATADTRARGTLERAKAEAAALLSDVRRAVAGEWERLKRGEHSRAALEQARRRLHEAAGRIAPEPRVPHADDEPLAPGVRVTAEHLGVRGTLVDIVGTTATVQSGAITVRVPLGALRRDGEPATPARPRHAAVEPPEMRTVPSELLLLGRTSDEACAMVEQYLDAAFLAGLGTVRLVHGKGTGVLRNAVRSVLDGHPLVASFREGAPSEGGAGATVAALKVS